MLEGDCLLAQRQQLSERLTASEQRLSALQEARPSMDPAWMMQLADQDERELLQQFSEMRGLLKHMSERDQVKWAGRIRRLEGVIFYRLVNERAARLQVLNKQQKELVALVDDIESRIVRVQEAEGDFVATVGTDFMAFIDRAELITAQVRSARENRETLLAGEIRQRMQQEMKQIQQYLLVTRIAIARATDQLAQVAQVENLEVQQ